MKVGVIGCGMIAKKAHMPAYKSLENVELIAVSDNNEQRAQSCAKEFGVKKYFSDYRELLKEDLDLVSICTPNFTHAQITKEAAQAGVHVLVEKPMATSLKEADEMLTACKENNVKLCVLHNLRFTPCLIDAKRRIDNGRIGRIISIQATKYGLIPMSWSPESWFYYKWGLLDDIGYHILDVINFLCDSPLENVQVVATDFTKNMDCLNYILSVMHFRNNATAALDLSWVSGCVESSIKIQGTCGLLNIDVRNDHIQEIHGYSTPLEDLKSNLSKSFKTMGKALNRSYFKGALLYHKLIIADYISSINNGKEPPIPGEEGRKAIVLMDAIKRSLNDSEKIARE